MRFIHFVKGTEEHKESLILYLAESLGYTLHYAKIADEEMMNASVESFNGNNAPLENLFEKIIEPLN